MQVLLLIVVLDSCLDINDSYVLCRKFLMQEMEEDDEVEEEIEREIGIIRVQLGFSVQMQPGRDREAQSIYNAVLRTKPSDIGLVAVASNNLLTLNRDQNIFDSKKRIKAAMADGLAHKLTSANRAAIARNNALLAMYTNQVSLCRTLVTDLADKFGAEESEQDLIVAGVLSRSGNAEEAVELLLKKKKGDDLERMLIATQIHLEKGDVAAALAILEKLPSKDRYLPGILSAMVTLHLASPDGGRHAAAKLLKEAVTFSSKKTTKKSSGSKGGGDMSTVWRKTAEFHLRGNEPEVAANSLEELLKLDPTDRQTMAQLVLAYAKFDLTKALQASKKLPDFSQGSVDVDALESSSFLGAKHAKKQVYRLHFTKARRTMHVNPISDRGQDPQGGRLPRRRAGRARGEEEEEVKGQEAPPQELQPGGGPRPRAVAAQEGEGWIPPHQEGAPEGGKVHRRAGRLRRSDGR